MNLDVNHEIKLSNKKLVHRFVSLLFVIHSDIFSHGTNYINFQFLGFNCLAYK